MSVKFERLELFVVTVETRSGDDDVFVRKTYTFIDPATERVLFEYDDRTKTTNEVLQKIAQMVGRP